MEIIGFIIVSLALSKIAFNIALKSSIFRCIQWPGALEMAFYFSLVQAFLLALGWFIGYLLSGWLGVLTVPLSILIFAFIGVRMILEAKRIGEEQRTMAVRDRRILLGFSLIAGMNAFIIGITLGVLHARLAVMAPLLFGTVFVVTLMGVWMGKRGMVKTGLLAEMAGGAAMLLIAAFLFLQYLKIL